MSITKLRIKKIEMTCFFFKEQMNFHATTNEALEEFNSSPLENLLGSFIRRKQPEFMEASKTMRRKLEAEGDMFLAYDDSSSQNGRKGFAITSCGVYAKNGGKVSFVDFETLSRTDNLRFEDEELRADGRLVAVFSGPDESKESMIEFFDELIDILQGKYDSDTD